MIDYQSIINQYYKEDTPLRHILLTHSLQVTQRALSICDRHPELHLDRDFLEAAAMLHDIGIIGCDAPGIECYGKEPYICHGIIGAKMLGDTQAMAPYARVCARHTGAGITRDEIVRQGLPLPLQDFLPETLEEQVICYADKFYSKSRLDHEKTIEEALRSLRKFGEDGVHRFLDWAEKFEAYR